MKTLFDSFKRSHWLAVKGGCHYGIQVLSLGQDPEMKSFVDECMSSLGAAGLPWSESRTTVGFLMLHALRMKGFLSTFLGFSHMLKTWWLVVRAEAMDQVVGATAVRSQRYCSKLEKSIQYMVLTGRNQFPCDFHVFLPFLCWPIAQDWCGFQQDPPAPRILILLRKSFPGSPMVNHWGGFGFPLCIHSNPGAHFTYLGWTFMGWARILKLFRISSLLREAVPMQRCQFSSLAGESSALVTRHARRQTLAILSPMWWDMPWRRMKSCHVTLCSLYLIKWTRDLDPKAELILAGSLLARMGEVDFWETGERYTEIPQWSSADRWECLCESRGLLSFNAFSRLKLSKFMLCARCQRPLYSKLSSLCNPCAAAQTLEVELAEPWENEKLRVIAGDIAVSAVRQVRALRLYRPPLAPEATSKAAPARPPLERRPGAARERSRSRGREAARKKEVEEQRKPRAEREGTSDKAPQQSRSETRPERVPQEENRKVPYSPSPDSYYSTSSAGESKKVTLAEPEVAEKRHKEDLVGSRGTEERPEKAKRRESGAGPIPAVAEAGSAEDKKRSKEEYLAYVNSDKGSVKLEENPESRSAERPRGNLLKVFPDEPEKRGDGKRKRKKHQWFLDLQPRLLTQVIVFGASTRLLTQSDGACWRLPQEMSWWFASQSLLQTPTMCMGLLWSFKEFSWAMEVFWWRWRALEPAQEKSPLDYRRTGHIHCCASTLDCNASDDIIFHTRVVEMQPGDAMEVPYVGNTGKRLLKQVRAQVMAEEQEELLPEEEAEQEEEAEEEPAPVDRDAETTP